DDRMGQQIRVAKRVSNPVSGQGIFEIAGVPDQGPSRSVALSEISCRSAESSQAANQRAALDFGTQLRAVCLQHLEKAAPHVAPKCRREPLSRNCRKYTVAGIR